jgi:peptidoglycan L-alanyl-D-glutamate endopeptidase CwlK
MPKFGNKSSKARDTLDFKLKMIVDAVIQIYDFSIVWGFRGEVSQNKAYDDGNSKVKWPYSNHNKKPSQAMDLVPYINGKQDWNNEEEFFYLAGLIMMAAHAQGVKLKWGGRFKDFRDLGHFEIINI